MTLAAVTCLVQQAPALDEQIVADLLAELARDGRPLALAIARVVELVRDRRVDAGIALPALAMACATLDDPTVTEREREVARYEVDTLVPLVENGSARRSIDVPDVPITALSRGPRPRT